MAAPNSKTAAARAASRHRPTVTNRLWFQVHGWAGVNLGIMLFVIMFSGTLATVSHEIDWLANPALRVTPDAETVSIGTMIDAAQRALPELEPWFVYVPRNAYTAAEIQMWDPHSAEFTDSIRRVYVNPYSGAVQGIGGWLTVQRTLRNFHMSLSLPAMGLYVVGSFALVLATSVVSSLIFYKRWWQRFFVLRQHRGRRVFWSDAHRAAGLWTLWFTLLMVVTGVWYLVEQALWDAGKGLEDIPHATPVVDAARVPSASRPSIDELAARARAAFPELEIATIYLPGAPNEAVRFTGHADAWLVRDRANNVFLDPVRGEVLATVRGENLPLTYRWVHTADPLHFGDFGGLATKLIWVVFGLLSSSLSLTGAYLWYRRQMRGRESLNSGSLSSQETSQRRLQDAS